MPFREVALALLTFLFVASGQQIKPHGLVSSPAGLNTTALELFERSRRSYERTYPLYGRVPSQIADDALPIDFEIETCARLKLTPELLLIRGGIDDDLARKSAKRSGLVQDTGKPSADKVFPKVSKWFSLSIDGTGAFLPPDRKARGLSQKYLREFGTFRQDMSGQIELETIGMRPKDVLESNFTDDLHAFLERLYAIKKSHAAYWKKKGLARGKTVWYPLPFQDSAEIHLSGGANPTAPCSKCHVQWTVGVPLHQVTRLFAMSGSKPLQAILFRANSLCAQRKNGCNAEYQAFISLAAWVLTAAHTCAGCTHPKRCMVPWLVRTHFGDLAMHVQEKLGAKSLERAPADILHLTELSGDERVLPLGGPIDYLRLPEMAEISGMVYPRNPALQASHKETAQDMPTDVDGLLKLSTKMLQHSDLINKRLQDRGCGLHSRTSISGSDFTVNKWLQGLLLGKDLMSDHDSPMSKSSFSHLIWKSMGSWRMKPGSDRIYMECRKTGLCLDSGDEPGPAALIQMVGRRMRQFEVEMGKAARQDSTNSNYHWAPESAKSAGKSALHRLSRKSNAASFIATRQHRSGSTKKSPRSGKGVETSIVEVRPSGQLETRESNLIRVEKH